MTQEIEQQMTPSHGSVWQPQETDPAVVMDVEMGKTIPHGEVIDVNYQALRESLRTSGAPADNSDLIVAIAPQRRMDVLKGYFSPDSEEYRAEGESGPIVAVGSNPSRKRFGPAFTQKVLQHELKHYAEHLNGIDNSNPGLYAVANTIHSRAPLIAGSAITGEALDVASHFFSPIPPGMSAEAADRLYGLLDNLSTYGALFALGTVALTGVFYATTQSEVRARAAENVDQMPFISRTTHADAS